MRGRYERGVMKGEEETENDNGWGKRKGITKGGGGDRRLIKGEEGDGRRGK